MFCERLKKEKRERKKEKSGCNSREVYTQRGILPLWQIRTFRDDNGSKKKSGAWPFSEQFPHLNENREFDLFYKKNVKKKTQKEKKKTVPHLHSLLVCESVHQIRRCSPATLHWESAFCRRENSRSSQKISTSLTAVKEDEQSIPVLQNPLNLYLGVIWYFINVSVHLKPTNAGFTPGRKYSIHYIFSLYELRLVPKITL